jgi:hypothetical protein
VGSPTFASFDVFEAEDMAQSFSPGFAVRLLGAVAQRVGALPPGRYLLTHETGADHVGLLRAIPEWEVSAVRSLPARGVSDWLSRRGRLDAEILDLFHYSSSSLMSLAWLDGCRGIPAIAG